MLLLNNEVAYKKAWAYKDIGRSFDAVYHQQHSLGFRWLTESAGSNFRMTEFQAAIGLKQLGKLPNWITQRNHNAEKIIRILKKFDFVEVDKPEKISGNLNAYYRLYAKLKAGVDIGGLSGESLRNAIISRLENVGVPCFVGSCSEIYREKLFADLSDLSKLSLPNAANWAINGFCFLVHPTITAEQLTLIALNIERVMLDIQKK
jgi:dTDP-4-amino-4,6-dideoxygalactose transaminase